MSEDQKKAEGEEQKSPKEKAVQNGVKAAISFVARTTRDLKEFAEQSDDDFAAFMNGVRAAANGAVRSEFPSLRAYTDKESRSGFVLGFIDREDGNKRIFGSSFKIGDVKVPQKEQS